MKLALISRRENGSQNIPAVILTTIVTSRQRLRVCSLWCPRPAQRAGWLPSHAISVGPRMNDHCGT
jgi:hypothetical protein